MEIMEIILTILSLLLTIVGIIITLCVSGKYPEPLRPICEALRRICGEGTPLKIPEYGPAGQQRRNDYISLVDKYINLNLANSDELGFREGENPFKPSVSLEQLTLEQPVIDCICTALSRNGRIYLILPSAKSQPDIEGVGRTAITVRLLDLRPPYTRLMGIDRNRLNEVDRLALSFPASGTWKLIASDMAYLGVSEGRLCMVPTKGEKVNFLWDLTRHIFRSTDLTYSSGAHRDDLEKRKELIDLFYKMPCEGLKNLYAGSAPPYFVNEILIVRREQAAQPGVSLRVMSEKKVPETLEESILISTNQHGSPFWNRSREKLKPVVRYLFDQIATRDLPVVRELVINSTEGNVPGFLYDSAVRAINRDPSEVPDIDEAEWGRLLLGVDTYNSILFKVLFLVTQIKMLVTSGEKVFHDGAFWRYLANLKRPFELEILMLNPDSNLVQELEQKTYHDKPIGFLRNEIMMNLDAIKRVKAYLEENCPSVSVQCYLYQDRPTLRMTFIGNERGIIAFYFPGSRTGADTLFFDLYGPQTRKFVKSIRQQYELVKQSSLPCYHSLLKALNTENEAKRGFGMSI